MESIFGLLSFFGGPSGPVIIGIVTAAMIIVWDWRLALAGLFIVQVGVVSAAVALGQLASESAGVMVVVMGLASLILALSAYQMTRTTSLYQSGTWPLRALLLALVYVAWELAEVNLPLPFLNPQLSDLFIWLGLCMLVILGLSNNPLFSTIAFLLWLIPVQIITSLIIPAPTLVALIGTLALLLALAGSYLILVEQVTIEEAAPVVTDISFPDEVGIPAATNLPQEVEESLVQWLERQGWGAAMVERTRQLMEKRRP